jgi:uncharacterized membrane protein (DUF106 family)
MPSRFADFYAIKLSSLGFNLPAVLILLLSIVIGLLMVVVFRYTSDQKAIGVAKDRLKAHLLAVRLFQDQLSVVLKSYGRILRETGRYLRLAFRPLLFVVIPLVVLVVQVDRYMGSMPLRVGQAFLLTARAADADTLNEMSLQLPEGLSASAPAVHVPAESEVVWRLVAEKDGYYDVNVQASGQTLSKRVVVASGLPRLSSIRMRARFWERIFISGESALPDGSRIQAIAVDYPARTIGFAGFEWNWIWLFFVLSLAAGFVFKSVLGIKI